MSGQRDHAKAKRRIRARFGERIDWNTRGVGPSRIWRNLRDTWDGPAFPVEVTLRHKDYNGFTPDEDDQ